MVVPFKFILNSETTRFFIIVYKNSLKAKFECILIISNVSTNQLEIVSVLYYV